MTAIRTKLQRLAALGAALLLCTLPVSAQTSTRLTAGKANEYGLIYSLPLTVADIYLQVKITEQTPGEFHNYARRYLGSVATFTEANRTTELTEAVIVPRGEANPEQRWLAQFKVGSTPFLILSPDGTPLSINSEVEYAPIIPVLPEASEWTSTPLDSPAATQAVTADMARSSSTAKRAELAAQRIFELREMRSDILSGQADNMPSDGAAMQLVLDNISAQEEALMAMFMGVQRSRNVVAKVTVIPDSTDMRSKVVARVSALEGIIDADDLAGEPVTVDLTVIERGVLPVNERGEAKTFPRGGVAYCVPGTARLAVSFRGRQVNYKNFLVAQLGVVFGLNPALFTDKTEPSMVVFDPTCGAVVELGPVQ